VCQSTPPLTSVEWPTTHLSIVLGKLCIPAVNGSGGEGFIHIQYLFSLICLVVLQSSTDVAMVAVWGCCNMTQVSVFSLLANPMLGMLHS